MTRHWQKQPDSRDDFQIGILTALDLETEAVIALFERTFDHSYGTHILDHNTYTIGQISGKPVVLCQLISMGKLNASRAAEQMRLSFQNLAVVFVAGIAGGNPSDAIKPPILLGDVAIGTQVLEMDYGKMYADRLHRKKEDELSKPNYRIASFLTSLRPLSKRLGIMQKIDQHTSNESHPGEGKDILYHADYLHKHQTPSCQICTELNNRHNETCDEAKIATCQELGCNISDSDCDINRVLSRDVVAKDSSVRKCHLHFGVIASGSSVIKSGRHRDLVCKSVENVVALEMEGAGVWEVLPTIIVKGICDYADSHKNKDWQAFASARAATCVEALIQEWVLRKDDFNGSSTAIKHWTSPTSRVPKPTFVGYSGMLERLTKRIIDIQSHQQIIFVLSGMGGIGKTEIALQILRNPDIREIFWGVFWIDCGTEISVQESFSRIATVCQWKAVSIQDIKDRLADHTKPILLVLDNCDTPDIDYASKYIPFASHVKVLLTGRPKTLQRYATTDGEGNRDFQYVDGLSRDASKELILVLSEKDALENTIHVADELATMLGHHPLAIHVACSILRTRKGDISDYIEWLKDPEHRPRPYNDFEIITQTGFIDQTSQDAQYGRIYNTFELSASMLEGDAYIGKTEATWALGLLDIAACIDRTNISRDLFLRAWSFETTVMQRTADTMTLGLTDRHIALCRQFLKERPAIFKPCSADFWTEEKYPSQTMQAKLPTDNHRKLDTWGNLLKEEAPETFERLNTLRQAMDQLCAVELATMSETENTISFHPVVHSWAKLRLKRKGTKENTMAICGSILALAVGDTVDWIPRNTDLRRHMEAYLDNENWDQIHEQHDTIKKNRTADIRDDISDDSTVVSMRDSQEREASRWRLIDKCRVHMAFAYPLVHMRSTKVTEDLEGLVNALATLTNQAAYGMHHLRAQELLNASLNKDDPKKIPQQKNIVATLENYRVRPTHDLLVAQRNLADAYLEGGRTTEAIEYLQRLEDQHKVEDYEYDNDLLAIQQLLGVAYRTRGDPDIAVQILQRVVEKREAYEEVTNESLCTAKRYLAEAYLDAGRLDFAFQILEATHEIMLKTRSKDDHFLLLIEQTLATAWNASGNKEAAIELLENIVETRRSTYGPQQPECLEAAKLLKKIEEEIAVADKDDVSVTWDSMDEAFPPSPKPEESKLVYRMPRSGTGKRTYSKRYTVASDDEEDEAEDSGGVKLDELVG